MRSLNTFSNHVGGLSAKTFKAPTHALRTVMSGFGERNIASEPTKPNIGDPPSLSTCRCNPHSSFTSSVNDCQSPLCLEFKHILVGNQLSPKRVYNFDTFVPQNKFGLNPYHVCNCDQYKTKHQFKSDLNRVGSNKIGVSGKKRDQHNRDASPHKIASRTKSFIHTSIIAGETQ